MTLKQFARSNFLKKVASVFLTKGVLFLVSFGSSILSARVLGPAGRGIIGTASTIGGIGAQFMNLGMHGANGYMLAHDKTKLGPLWVNTLLLSGAASIVAVGVYIFLRKTPVFGNLQGVMLILACLYIPVGLYQMLQQNLLVGIGAVGVYNALELFQGILYPVLLFLLAFQHILYPESAFSATLVSVIASILIGALFLMKQAKGSIRPDGKLFKECLPFGLKSYTASLCSYLVIRFDILMVNYLLGDVQTGLYTTAVSLSDVLSLLPTALGTVLFPTAAAISSDRQRSDFMKRTLILLAPTMGVLTLAAALLARSVFGPLYGEAFVPSADVFIILMPGIFFMSMQSALSHYFAAKNMWTGNILTPLVGLLMNLCINALLIPQWGIRGAAAASAISYTMMFLIMFIRFIGDVRKAAEETL
jgi:O-antigen/teichoic acid export membrane protein